MMRKQTAGDLVIQLHQIARTVEQQIGIGQLSDDIRKIADRLHVLTSELDNRKKAKE